MALRVLHRWATEDIERCQGAEGDWKRWYHADNAWIVEQLKPVIACARHALQSRWMHGDTRNVLERDIIQLLGISGG